MTPSPEEIKSAICNALASLTGGGATPEPEAIVRKAASKLRPEDPKAIEAEVRRVWGCGWPDWGRNCQR